jgi:mono/diheme cytochrome c family protein
MSKAHLGLLATALPMLWLQSGTTQSAQVERGRYLVEEVAQCGMCHTPHDAGGQMDRSHWLAGATVWIVPVQHVSDWAFWAPPLAGAPGFSDQQITAVLMRGTSHDGSPLRPPMHAYHMHSDDAAAIVAYLRSLPTPARLPF